MKKTILLGILAVSNLLLGTACVVNKEQPATTTTAPVRTTTTTTESHEVHAY